MAQREYYYSNGGGTQQGPLEIGGVQRLFSIGSITAATAFWYQGMSGWLPLPQLPELASAVGIAAAQLSDASQQVQSAAASASGGDHSGAGADPRYTTERGLTVFTDPSGTKTVWDDARQEWLPYEQAMYMLGDAEAPAAPKVEDMEAKLEATRPLDEVGQELKAKAEIEERIKAKEAKKKGLPVPGKRAQPAESAKVNLEAAAAAFKADARERFVGSETFTGPRSGYVFNCGGSGTGYYLDLLEVSKELLLKRKADGGLTEAERIRRNKKKTDWRKQKKATTFQAAKINTNVFVQGLPVDTTTERLVEYFSKCGLIRRDQLTDEPCVKLYKDGVTGAPKGEGLVSFEKEESVDLAIELLDGDQNMAPGHTLRVTPAEFTQKGEKFVPKQRVKLTEEDRKRLALKKKEQASKLSWNDGDGEGVGMRIVVLKHVFHPDDARAAYNFYEELHEEIEDTMGKIGEVEKITIFRDNPLGVVAVKFVEGGAAQLAIERMHRAKMAGREVSCEYFDNITDYRMKEDAKEVEKRVDSFGDFLNEDVNPDKI